MVDEPTVPAGGDGGGSPLPELVPATPTPAPEQPVDQGAATPPAAPAEAPASGGWLDRVPPEVKTWAESKGWKGDTDPAIIMQAHRNLESLMGADKAGRTVLLPKDDSDVAARDAILEKLGKPPTPDGYDFKIEGGDEEFVGTAKEWFHKAGLTKSQAAAVAESYRAMEMDAMAKVQQEHKAQEESLRKTWAADFDGKIGTARAAAQAYGLTNEEIGHMVAAAGPLKVYGMLEFFGRNYVEDSPPDGASRLPPAFGGTSPAAAEAKIRQLRGDQNFLQRYTHEDAKIRGPAIEELAELYRLAERGKVR